MHDCELAAHPGLLETPHSLLYRAHVHLVEQHVEFKHAKILPSFQTNKSDNLLFDIT